MKESQHLEWKETWRDEFLRWICGFANADGGVLQIGKNNRGDIIGLAQASKLLEGAHLQVVVKDEQKKVTN